MWTSLAIFCFIHQARATGWDDFTNNLATDLAPLIALFGEQATKQFLSESTSPLDNIIFAVCPLGILTAVVAVIRVLGSASLRAFVGRAQEGRGQAEAELCSSTSYDVCELWNNGGIARVFGRPRILEFIFDKEEVETGEKRIVQTHGYSSETENSNRDNLVFYEVYSGGMVETRPTAGIYKPQEYQKTLPVEPDPDKNHAQGNDDATTEWAPNPNLSLNVGIKRPSSITLYGAAIFGCLMQASVLGYGAWAVFIQGLMKEDQSTTHLYFWLALTGTLLLVIGMFLCAWLIEKSTQERKFKFNKEVFWLQPGNQRVGDQTFEAFAYSTNLKEYITSWKNEEDGDTNWRRGAFIRLAISTSIFGFVLQFTGLRGLHSSVAMYQFAATLSMVLVRSLLRTQRLKESENLLRGQEFQGQGEDLLDWQALKIGTTIINPPEADNFGHRSSTDGISWKILEEPYELETEQIEDIIHQLHTDTDISFNVNDDGSAAWASCLGLSTGDQVEWDGRCANVVVKWMATLETPNPHQTSRTQPPNDAKKLLCFRSRLSYLTDDSAPTTDQRWNSAAREQAVKLQTAIQSAANYVFSDASQAKVRWDLGKTAAFCWALNCYAGYLPAGHTGDPVHLMVRRVRGQWRIDICQLEAVLGLWVRSIKMKGKDKKRKEMKTEGKKGKKEAKGKIDQLIKDANAKKNEKGDIDSDLLLARKIFANVSLLDTQARKQAEIDLDLWVLREHRQPVYDTLDNQASTPSQTAKRKSRPFPTSSLPVPRKLLSQPNPKDQQNQQVQDIKLLSIQTQNSVLVMATQDIFTSFIDALASVTSQLKGVNLVQSLGSNATANEDISVSVARPFFGLSHHHTERLADLFTQAGLGSQEDALMSVIPSFRSRSLLPSLLKEYQVLNSQARKLIGEGRRDKAESLLMALHSEAESDSRDSDGEMQLWRAAAGGHKAAVELLLTNDKIDVNAEDRYGRTPLSSAAAGGHKAVVELLLLNDKVDVNAKDLYDVEGKSFIEERTPLLSVAADQYEAIVERLLAKDRVNFDAKGFIDEQTPLSRAAARGHEAVVELLLTNDKVDVNAMDAYEQTPLLNAAAGGHKAAFELLLANDKVDINAKDRNGQTSLSNAAAGGHEAVVELLLANDNTDVNAEDKYGQTPLWRAAAGGHKAVVERLLAKDNVDVDAKDMLGQTPLSSAAAGGHKAVVELLLANDKVEVNAKDHIGWTPLSSAAASGYKAVVELLLANDNVDVNTQDKYSQTPLSRAAARGQEAIVELLLANNKVDINANAQAGKTPLSMAAAHGHEAVVKLLLANDKVDINAKDKFGQTPIWRAAAGGHEAVVQLLLAKDKVDVNA
jgi:ankyrin repeat protein